MALVSFICIKDLCGQVNCIGLRSISCVCGLVLTAVLVVLLAALEPVPEVLDVVDQDKLLLGAGVHEVSEDDVAARVHPHVSECVLGEAGLNEARRQFSFLFQNENIADNLLELAVGQLLVVVLVDQPEDTGELVDEGNVGEGDGDEHELAEGDQPVGVGVQSVEQLAQLHPVLLHVVLGEEGHHGLQKSFLVNFPSLISEISESLLHIFRRETAVWIDDDIKVFLGSEATSVQ